jgi:serine/threonine-protein kinase
MSHATRPDLPAPGQSGTIAGYRLDSCIGQGSAAAVYLVRDEHGHGRVALKVMAPELASDAGFRTRMIRESRAAAALDHPHIIPVFEADEAGGTLFVAMRYVRGGDARSLLSQLGPLPPGYAGQIVTQIASALDAVHTRGLTHRDVRPVNILLDGDAGDHAYLSDFGMSTDFTPGQIIAAERAGGSLDYLAPEQIEGHPVDGRADLYSLACTGFELLCGTPPFGPDQGQTLMYAQIYADPPAASTRRAGLPAAVDSVLATALAKDPADRYQSCGRFAEELSAALGVRPGDRSGPMRPRQAPAVTGHQPAVTSYQPAVTSHQAAAVGNRPAVSGNRPAAVGQRPAAVGDRPAAVGDEPGAVGQRPTVVRERAAPLEERPAAAPFPLRRAAPGGAASGPAGPRRRALRLALAAAAVLAVIVAAVAGVALSKRSAPAQSAASPPASRSASPSATGVSATSSPSGPVLAAQQAAALDTLLKSSAKARTALRQAVTQVGACANLPGAISQLQEVANQRSSEYGRSSALTTSALPGGAKVKSALVAALGRSLKADQDYLAWAREQRSGGCTPTSQSSAYSAAFSASQQADAAKQVFVQVWNPVAARYGIAQESPRDI